MGYLEKWARERPAKTAVCDGDTSLTYAEYAEFVRAVAAAVRELGLAPGTTVGVALPKMWALPAAYLGVAAAGCIPFPLDYKNLSINWTAIQVNYHPRLVIISERIEYDFAWPARTLVLENVSRGAAGIDIHDVQAEDVFYLNVTSGSLGKPRAAAASHKNVIVNALAANATLGLGADDVYLCTFAAFSHPHETFARALVAGATAIFLDSIMPRQILAAVERYAVTALMGVPPMFRTLLEVAHDYDTSSLRVAEAGGMVTPALLMTSFKKVFGLPLTRVWGSAETSGIAFVADEEAAEASLGRPVEGYEVSILNEEGEEVLLGEVGELAIAGAACVKAFWEMGSLRPLAAGAIRTGDLVRKERDGSFTFVDRRNGAMKVAGEKVFAGEIERVLAAHPAVAEVAVVAAPDEVRGEVPVAYIVPYPRVEFKEQNVKDFIKSRLAPVKRPKKIFFVKELPRLGGGKIDKRALSTRTAVWERLFNLDEEILHLLNVRARLWADARGLTVEERERIINRLLKHNRGPLHDETAAEIFRYLNNLLEF